MTTTVADPETPKGKVTHPLQILIEKLNEKMTKSENVPIEDFQTKFQEHFDFLEINHKIYSQYFWMCVLSGRIDELITRVNEDITKRNEENQ